MNEIVAFIFKNQWMVFLTTTVLLVSLAEAGFRSGFRLFVTRDEQRKSQIGTIQGAILGMLALLLGFTFSMAVGRYENRRDLVLQEANSIGTTFLRASLLPAEHKIQVENLLRRYVDTRLDFFAAGRDDSHVLKAESESARLQRELWSHAVVATREVPTAITATFITSLNETIDLDESRLTAFRSRVPAAVWPLLLVVAGVGCYATGYGAGASGARTVFSNLMLPLLLAFVVTIIADFDHPRHGLISISQQPMLDLKSNLAVPAASPASGGVRP